MYFLCIGHSHLDALKWEYMNGRARGAYADIELEFIDLHDTADYTHYAVASKVLHTQLIAAVDAVAAARAGPPAAVFLSIGGSEQHVISMLNHDQPLDVIVPWDTGAPITPGATLVPLHMMDALIRHRCDWKLNLLRAIGMHFDCPIYFFQAPPPIASEEHLRAYPGPRFAPLAEAHGFSPLPFRRKVADMHSAMYARCCDEAGVTYLARPPEGLNEAGNLPVESCEQDSIHANGFYGSLLAAQISVVQSALKERSL